MLDHQAIQLLVAPAVLAVMALGIALLPAAVRCLLRKKGPADGTP